MSKGTLLSLDPSQRLVIDLAKDESIEKKLLDEVEAKSKILDAWRSQRSRY